MKKYSVIVPVFNRPQEIDELLQSLVLQTCKDFEVLIVEDGSQQDCKKVLKRYENDLILQYFYKENTGPGDSRNFGMQRAKGEWLLFFDSDCLIPSDYFEALEAHLEVHDLDAYGGADDSHPSFSITQKAINYSMTSFLTTGGIRGKKNNLDRFQPRSFNMGIKRKVYESVGGFSEIHPGEDPDLSYRIMDAGFKVGFVPSASVYHKRRIDFGKFSKQVYKFGVVRTILMKWHPDKFKIVYLFPTLFLFGTIGAIVLGLVFSKLFLLPLAFLAMLLFLEALFKTKNPIIALLAIPASFIQLLGYGYGFLKGFIKVHLLKKEERVALKDFFF
ncbi:MAG: glycosyltransferase family 2 protein [Chitinophagales bacterium]